MDDGHVVVAGGSGFIGKALSQALSRDNVEVRILTRAPARPFAPGVRAVHWDGVGEGEWCAHLRGARAVVNLCGESIAGPRWTDTRKRRLMESRVRPGQALSQAIQALHEPPPVYLQASGVGFYGSDSGVAEGGGSREGGLPDEPLDERAPAGTDFLARLAAAWEDSSRSVPRRRVILRFGVVLGPGGALPMMLLPFRLWAGGRLGAGQQWLSWVHLADAVDAVRFCLAHPDISGPVNVVAPGVVRNVEFARVAGRVLRRPNWVPTPALALRAALGEQATLLLEGQRAVPRVLQNAGFRFGFAELGEALQDLV